MEPDTKNTKGRLRSTHTETQAVADAKAGTSHGQDQAGVGGGVGQKKVGAVLNPCELALCRLLDKGVQFTQSRAAWFKWHWSREFEKLSDPHKVHITQHPTSAAAKFLQDRAYDAMSDEEERRRNTTLDMRVEHPKPSPAFYWFLGFAAVSLLFCGWLLVMVLKLVFWS